MSPRGRRIAWHAVATSSALHLLAALCLSGYLLPGPQDVHEALPPVVIRLINPSPVMPPASPAVPAVRRERSMRRSAPVLLPSANDSRRQEENASEEAPKGPPSPYLSVDAMIDTAKRNIGNIDKELRQAFPSRVPASPQPSSSPLAKGIAAAGLPRLSHVAVPIASSAANPAQA